MPAATADEPTGGATSEFSLEFDGFSGPFDLLLRLISKHELDIVEISLSRVTEEFIAYVQRLDERGQLEQASEFLVMAATLLDIKIAELLPRGEVVDPEDVAILEARDLLFARLLQYRAFREAAAWFEQQLSAEGSRHAREVALDPWHRSTSADIELGISADDLAALALLAFAPKEIPSVGLGHLHAPAVSIREQAAVVVAALRRRRQATFGELIADAASRGEIVARFLAVLELYRNQAVAFEQVEPLGPLQLRWVAQDWSDEHLAALGAEYDTQDGDHDR